MRPGFFIVFGALRGFVLSRARTTDMAAGVVVFNLLVAALGG